MKTMFIASLAVLSTLFYSCEKENEPQDMTPKSIELTAKATEVISGSNDFGIELFTKTSLAEDQNLMLSPFSASAALTMLLNGCGGETYTQLHQALNYPEGLAEVNEAYKSLVSQLLNADPKVNLSIANAIFYRLGFNVKQPFLNTMSDDFNAHVEGLDFSLPSSLTRINKWASDNTNSKIPKVMDEISPDAVMFLMNALYFKGNWSSQFDKSLTAPKPFYPDNGNSKNVSTMFGEVKARTYTDNKQIAIELPYGRSNFTMVVLVPVETLSSYIATLTPADWNNITQTFDSFDGWRDVQVEMPKFKFSYEKVLNDQLKSMGMIDAFEAYLANLSGISDASIFVSFVKQNTFVEVNEEGTEAAAVTTIGVELTSVGPGPLKVNKPFVFAIRERTTNTLLFIGKVVDPASE